jgi:hypothetical protein
MDSNDVVLNMKLIENDHDDHIRNQELGVFDILKEALVIIFKNFNLIIFIFLVSIPLFCFLVYYERTLVETLNILRQTDHGFYDHNWPASLHDLVVIRKTKHVYYKLVQLGFLYLVPLHLLELCTVVVTIHLSSKIYAKEETAMTLITSFYVLFLSTFTLLGLISFVTHWVNISNSVIDFFFQVFYGAIFLPLAKMYLEWSAMWNMSIVISVLEGIYGGEAFALSAYYSKGSEWCGLILMLIFSVWGLGLRLPCVFFGCYEGGIGIVVRSSRFCWGNVLKWVVFVVYFYDCKKRTL